MSTSERILAACCSDSTVDVFVHAARVTEIVVNAKRTEPIEQTDEQRDAA